MEENPNRKNIKKVWKDYTTADVIAATEKAMQVIKPKTIPVGENCVRMLCMTLKDL